MSRTHQNPDVPWRDETLELGPTPAPDRRCIFRPCVATWAHSHGGFPGGYDNPDDPEGPPIAFTDPDPDPTAVRDYNGAALPTPAPDRREERLMLKRDEPMTVTPPALDVERLARAMSYHFGDWADTGYPYYVEAEKIAAEYARLSAHPRTYTAAMEAVAPTFSDDRHWPTPPHDGSDELDGGYDPTAT